MGSTELEADSEDARRARHEGSDVAIIGEGMDLIRVGELGDLLLNLKKKGNVNQIQNKIEGVYERWNWNLDENSVIVGTMCLR